MSDENEEVDSEGVSEAEKPERVKPLSLRICTNSALAPIAGVLVLIIGAVVGARFEESSDVIGAVLSVLAILFGYWRLW